MTLKRVLLILAVICASQGVFARHLLAEDLDATPECTPSWSTSFDFTLANTLESGRTDLGRASFSLLDEETLYFRVETPEGSRIKGLRVQRSNNLAVERVVELPMTTQWRSTVEDSISSNDTAFAGLLTLLRSQRASLTVDVADEEAVQLVGILRDDCNGEGTAMDAEILRLPACNVPGFSELYTIPLACNNFAQRLEIACGLQVEEALVASIHDAEGRPVEQSLAVAACLPKGCNPCAPHVGLELEAEEVWLEADLDICREHGFPAFYAVPIACANLPDRLRDFCGVELQDVLQASATSLGLNLDGICLPSGCDPCTSYPSEEEAIQEALRNGPPICSNTYLFGKAYDIPAGCGDFQGALRDRCGIEAEAVAAASGMDAYPAFAGFGEGKTVCLPEACEPCGAQQIAES